MIDDARADGYERPPLYFWFTAPPRVSRGLFNELADRWGNTVTYVCDQDYRQERKALGWDEGGYGSAQVLILGGDASAADRILAENRRAVHVFAGFRGPTGKYLDRGVRRFGCERVAVFSERSGSYGSLKQRVLRRLGNPIQERIFRKRYGDALAAFLPLGQLGVTEALRHGWDPERVFPLMYCPAAPNTVTRFESRSDPFIRMAYVGRFSKFTKGVDVLMEAVDRTPPGQWNLTLAGGHGDHAVEIIDWANNCQSAEFVGPWPAAEVVERLNSFDVCIVPSRFDGWNVVINEAIAAGVGVIATDQTVSHEMVTAGKLGMVVPSEKPEYLAKVIALAAMDRELVESWRRNAVAYAPRVSAPQIADYLIDVINYALLGRGCRPVCPWL